MAGPDINPFARMRGVTREQKLALIVGFSLILFVGVLISDHLSSARKVKIGKVEDTASLPITSGSIPPPGPASETHAAAPSTQLRDPLDLILNAPSRNTDTPAAPTPDNRLAAAPPVDPAPTNPVTPNPIAAPAPQAPQTIAARNPDHALADEVRRLGGDVTPGPDGVHTIKLPPAISIINHPTTSPKPSSQLVDPKPIATPAGPLQPLKTHEVRAGDTLFQITQRYYGNGNLWRDLAKFNNMDKAGTVRVGSRLKIPSRDVLLGKAPITQDPVKLLRPTDPKPQTPKATPSRDRGTPKIELASYTVRRGDTLGNISLKTLGTSKRWQEIADLNNLDDEDAISAGTVLKIPARRS
jgi:nucleoid-associated protein YgaU